jgi:hypothetical protein
LLKQGDSFAPRVRDFAAQIGFAEGKAIKKIEGDSHGLGSLVRDFAEFVDVGDDGGGDQAIFAPFFGDFDEAGFGGLGVVFRFEELAFEQAHLLEDGLPAAGVGGLDLGDGLVSGGFGSGAGLDVGVLGFEVGDELLEVGDLLEKGVVSAEVVVLGACDGGELMALVGGEVDRGVEGAAGDGNDGWV